MQRDAGQQVGGAERIAWDLQQVTLTRVPGYGFGIAVSGGRDNPHFANGDPAIAISDVLKAGPAEGKLQVNDRIVSANGVSLENVEYATAVQVLRDSGATVALQVRRRVALPAPAQGPATLTLRLTKASKKDDLGVELGSQVYVRAAAAGAQLRRGDVLLRIGGHSCDGLSLKEARRLLDAARTDLTVVVRRHPAPAKEPHGPDAGSPGGCSYSAQNLYVQPPTRAQPPPPQVDDKSNLVPRGRARGPLLDVSLSQLDRPATPMGAADEPQRHLPAPPRPPPPRTEDYYSSRRHFYDDDPLLQRSKQPIPDPRFITFQKEGSVGIRLTGGNEVGIFVTAVQPGSPASLRGLQPGDKILKVNDMDMKGVTREEAVLFLLSLQDQIDLIVQHRREEYEQIVASQRGDSFHVKAHFNYDQPNKGEMSFRKGDVFHVVDTLHNGVVGSWQVFRIGRNNQEVQKGIIPNKARAEELATAQFNATKKELTASESRGSFFRRRRGSHRRSKSLGRDHWDDVVFADSISKFPAYERVVLRHPGFVRPVILFGPVADIAREKLLKDFPDNFTSPQLDSNLEEIPKIQKSSGIIRLSAIREITDRGKHALLDITPNAVDRLNYAQFYPVVVFLRAESKRVVKELRAGLAKAAHKSSKKLFEQSQKLERVWGHTFTCSVTLTSPDSWYRKVRELIERQQNSPIWMSENKPDEALSDDFLFPMASRLSYASSPESDLDLSPEPRGGGPTAPASARLVKSSSDPSVATQEDSATGPGYGAPPPYLAGSSYKQGHDSHNGVTVQHHHHGHNLASASIGKRRSRAGDGQYCFSPTHLTPATDEPPVTSSTVDLDYGHHHHRAPSPSGAGGPPELPPRVDRVSKPPPAATGRSAAERLFGKNSDGEPDCVSRSDPPNYINATPHHRMAGSSSLERRNMKSGSYDSVSSYDSYSNHLGPNAHDDLKCSTNGGPLSPRNHDPYRFTRSTAQPIKINNTEPKPNRPTDFSKYRPSDYNKPVPPPKSASYKPVPPPKPKNYRPPPTDGHWARLAADGNCEQHDSAGVALPSSPTAALGGDSNADVAPVLKSNSANSSMYRHSKSYSTAGSLDGATFTPHLNGAEETNGGFDSGHGSSLDRNYNPSVARNGAGGGQYYYNVPPSRNVPPDNIHSHHHSHHSQHNREPSGLDLANREQRGSAFELYKKPTDPRGNTMQHYLDNNLSLSCHAK